jgi:methylated-DNA-protein-cysteine methyltransferase-like protein
VTLSEFRDVVRRIPRGRLMTYGEVAEAAGHPGCARQVVWALQNSGPDVPWHRVVGAGHRIRLTGQPGLEQRLRLEAEGWRVRGSKLVPASEEDANPELKTARLAGRKHRAKAR